MSYLDARADLVSILEGLSSIERVYADFPESVVDIPCVIMFGSSGYGVHTFGGLVMPDSQETEWFRVIVRDQDQQTALEALRTVHDEFIDAISINGGLDSATVARVEWDRPTFSNIAGSDYPCQDYRIVMTITNP